MLNLTYLPVKCIKKLTIYTNIHISCDKEYDHDLSWGHFKQPYLFVVTIDLHEVAV